MEIEFYEHIDNNQINHNSSFVINEDCSERFHQRVIFMCLKNFCTIHRNSSLLLFFRLLGTIGSLMSPVTCI